MRQVGYKEIRVGDVIRIEYQTADAEVVVTGMVFKKYGKMLVLGNNHQYRVTPEDHYYLVKRKLCVADIEAAIVSIIEDVGDPERAHGLEESLHQSVLEAIAANECDDPKACAAAALKSRDIEFRRNT